MQPICTYELWFVRERSLVSCLVMAPIVTRPRASRRLSGAGLGIDTDSEIRVYDILDADADSNGPGSTWAFAVARNDCTQQPHKRPPSDIAWSTCSTLSIQGAAASRDSTLALDTKLTAEILSKARRAPSGVLVRSSCRRPDKSSLGTHADQ